MADLAKTVTKAARDPVGAATDLLTGALGIGKGASDKKYADRLARSREAVATALDGDRDALDYLGAVGRVAPLPRSNPPAPWNNSKGLPKGWTSKDWGGAYKKIVARAADRYRELKPGFLNGKGGTTWEGTTGTAPEPETAPPAGSGSPRPTPRPSAPSAPSAPKPRAKSPCPPGSSRNPETGRCRKVQAAPVRGFMESLGPKPKPACKYGPRDADGRCPKKPTGLTAGKLTKGQQALVRKAQTAAGNVAAKGAKGAVAAVSTALAGMSGTAIAAAGAAIIAAAAVGWLIGQDIRRSIDGTSTAVRIENTNRDRRHAVAALRERLGRQPTLAEQAPITAAWKSRIAAIKQGGFQGL